MQSVLHLRSCSKYRNPLFCNWVQLMGIGSSCWSGKRSVRADPSSFPADLLYWGQKCHQAGSVLPAAIPEFLLLPYPLVPWSLERGAAPCLGRIPNSIPLFTQKPHLLNFPPPSRTSVLSIPCQGHFLLSFKSHPYNCFHGFKAIYSTFCLISFWSYILTFVT